MWSAWFLFLLMWIGFWWMPKTPQTNPFINVHTPTFQQNCSNKQVQCVDDCSFLCVEPQAQCVGGVCVVNKPSGIECNKKRGGRIMLAKDTISQWMCLCTDETFWSGPSCNELNPDVCEHGSFLYNNRDSFLCICPYPYKKVVVKGKPHCVEQYMANFFQEELGLLKESIGPTTR